ncbi:Fur family transcriptional regulator [Jeongeupia naejangsanensis]|uniref:Transcriptional repressor n=1 Tax=Jeongeupia naejangsanensis TaxID=613195 RepID=A0ABS2BMB2_9NEIS|nr:transcriptional repressor [Jeongeupia naejangsanensis]MBM3116575.1 transcriptional repressor [Jeongeupia naejangsanensis]
MGVRAAPPAAGVDTLDPARELIARTGARATAARLRVLAALIAAQRPLSHLDVVEGLDPAIDRVTVYRVLEWLTDEGLAHKLAGDDRVWRFSVATVQHRHAHFHCRVCGRFYCIESFRTDLPVALPQGFAAEALEITIKGVCADCRESR